MTEAEKALEQLHGYLEGLGDVPEASTKKILAEILRLEGIVAEERRGAAREAAYRDLIKVGDTEAAEAMRAEEKARTRRTWPQGKPDYYDPARQNLISDHDCSFEDGAWWFGHGMPCQHPGLHGAPLAISYIEATWLGSGRPTRNTPAGEIIAILRGERTYETDRFGVDDPEHRRREHRLREMLLATREHARTSSEIRSTCVHCGNDVYRNYGWHHRGFVPECTNPQPKDADQ